MQKPLPRQSGLTLVTILLLLAVIGFFTLLTLKIIPIYMNHGRITNVLKSLKEQDVSAMSEHTILETIEKSFGIEYVEGVTKDDVTINKQGPYVKVVIEYEQIVPLCCNLSILAEFHDEFEKGEK